MLKTLSQGVHNLYIIASHRFLISCISKNLINPQPKLVTIESYEHAINVNNLKLHQHYWQPLSLTSFRRLARSKTP